MSQDPENQRRFSRVSFDASAHLSSGDGQDWITSLIDLSLNGALIAIPNNWQGQVGDEFILSFRLSGSDDMIRMGNVTVAHVEDGHIGLQCQQIDVDSITHLKRLVELNTGDPERVHREITELGR